MKNGTKVAILVGSILTISVGYYLYRNQKLKAKYRKIDLTTVKLSQMDSIIANPTLN